jgi:hypothetical protein
MRGSVPALLMVLAVSVPAAAQVAAPVRLVGRATQEHWQLDPNAKPGSRVVTDTLTLTFDSDAGPGYTIDFITRHPVDGAVPSTGVVDIVVAERPREDASPSMAFALDGQLMPLVARPVSARTVVTSVPFSEFQRLAGAGTIVDRTFNAELEFGAEQLRTLRSVAAQWARR